MEQRLVPEVSRLVLHEVSTGSSNVQHQLQHLSPSHRHFLRQGTLQEHHGLSVAYGFTGHVAVGGDALVKEHEGFLQQTTRYLPVRRQQKTYMWQ
jgi:hypothetical protein